MPAAPAALNVPESDWQWTVVDYARLMGWIDYHTFDSRKSAAGFPDLLLIRPPELVVVELKAERGRVTTAQECWLDLFRLVPGVDVYVWRPSDWSEVQRRLSRRG